MNMKKLLLVVLTIAVLCSISALADTFSIVTSRPGSGTTLDWGQLDRHSLLFPVPLIGPLEPSPAL